MTARFRYRYEQGSFEAAFRARYAPMAEAAQRAIAAAGAIVKAEGRADIAAAGLGAGFVKALRVDIYPQGRNSLNATAHIYHKIPYAGVFEEGVTIRGRPRLWLALPSTPQRYGRKPMTPELFRKSIGPLSFVKRPGKRPLLVAKAKKGKNMTKISLARFRSGGRGEGPFVSVPVFVGVDSVSIRKKLNISAIVRSASDRLPQLYASFISV
ncbi:hypothetical protein DK847_06685 [Aestuariivirga litoralis]|jgi:hypothetical protein|uniref:Uncharacterized protein n=1 Tax=Aestuariivirga litoralis TaxID=2650924 RepID=A0A2W2ARW2_9HYPH|nr:DUF6441 family protein [Aestuariivirga litoralis]PZF78101.1 hypothetical protein DK847_06685 [Aestuariivirga litoralis]